MDQMEMRKAFVGQNSEYYMNQWDPSQNNGMKVLVNKAAFSIFWFFYRKMYLIGMGILNGLIVISFIIQILLTSLGIPEPISINIGRFVTLGLWAYIGIKANEIYLGHVDRKIARVKEAAGTDLETALKKSGGVSAAGVLIPIVILFGYGVFMLWLISMLFKMI
jgi:hypothetical protein